MQMKKLPVMPVWRKVAKDGSFLLPAAFRRALGVKPGDIFYARMENDELVLRLKGPRKKSI